MFAFTWFIKSFLNCLCDKSDSEIISTKSPVYMEIWEIDDRYGVVASLFDYINTKQYIISVLQF